LRVLSLSTFSTHTTKDPLVLVHTTTVDTPAAHPPMDRHPLPSLRAPHPHINLQANLSGETAGLPRSAVRVYVRIANFCCRLQQFALVWVSVQLKSLLLCCRLPVLLASLCNR
jgi:hypothetical protein